MAIGNLLEKVSLLFYYLGGDREESFTTFFFTIWEGIGKLLKLPLMPPALRCDLPVVNALAHRWTCKTKTEAKRCRQLLGPDRGMWLNRQNTNWSLYKWFAWSLLRAVPTVETNTVFIAEEITYRNFSPQW
jgi:hypothetical protein